MFHRCPATAALAAWLVATPAAEQPPTFHAETRLVVLQATVKNSQGALVTSLDRGAFTVYENGRRQTISLVRRDDVPVSLGLVIDNSGSMRSLRANVEAAALAFVRASNPMDDVFVLNFADKPRIDVPFTDDVHALEAGIARVDSIGGTAMRDAVLMAESHLREHASHDRKVLLVITDGNDNASTASMSQLRKVVEHSEIAIFAIGLFRDGDRPTATARDDLDHLTEVTGGVAYYPRSIDRIDAIVLDTARQIRRQYTLAYTSSNRALDGSYRSIRVKVTGPGGLSVRNRPGYWATPVTSTIP